MISFIQICFQLLCKVAPFEIVISYFHFDLLNIDQLPCTPFLNFIILFNFLSFIYWSVFIYIGQFSFLYFLYWYFFIFFIFWILFSFIQSCLQLLCKVEPFQCLYLSSITIQVKMFFSLSLFIENSLCHFDQVSQRSKGSRVALWGWF